MSDTVKKPPISISGLKNGGKVEAQKGPLSYAGESSSGGEGGSGSRRVSKSGINYTQLVIGVGLSILAFFVISNFTLASKGDVLTLLDNQILLEAKQGALETEVSSGTQGIENVMSAQAVTDSQLSSFSNSISNLVNKMTVVEDGVTSLGDRVTALEGNLGEGDEDGDGSAVGGFLDYYLEGDRLHVSVGKTGWYIMKFILVPEAFTGGFSTNATDIKEYYTGSHYLEVGDWIDGRLPYVVRELLDTHDVYVSVLPGSVTGAGSEPGEW